MQASQVMQAIESVPGAAVLPGRVLPRRRYVITNQKGGQGKTTTTAALGGEFAAAGRRVRMTDCDPQRASLTFWFPPRWDDVDPASRFDLLHVLLGQVSLDEATWPTGIPGLSIVPSFMTATQFEALRPPGADLVLRQALDEAEPYDVELIDCPPNLGLLTVTALAAADEAIIPVLPGGLDMAGVSDLNQTLGIVKKRLNPDLVVAAVILRRIHRTAFGEAIERQLIADYPDAIFQVIRHSVRTQEAPTANQTLRDYAPKATTTADYRQLADRLDAAAARKASL